MESEVGGVEEDNVKYFEPGFGNSVRLRWRRTLQQYNCIQVLLKRRD